MIQVNLCSQSTCCRALHRGYLGRIFKKSFSRCLSSLQVSTAATNGLATVDACSLLAALKACSRSKDIKRGQEIHATATRGGFLPCNVSLGNSLVNMYAKCGNMSEALKVFHQMPFPSVVSWNVLISGYASNGESEVALRLFEGMKRTQVPNARTYSAALMACACCAAKERTQKVGWKLVKKSCLDKAMSLHSQLVASNCGSDMFLASTLISTYAKCGSMVDARIVFDRISSFDRVIWNALVLGYVENGECHLALDLFFLLDSVGLDADSRTVVAALMACTKLGGEEAGSKIDGKAVKAESLKKGKQVHSRASGSCKSDLFVCGSLIDMYVKCGSLKDARDVFESMAYHDVVSWTALISGYAENGEPHVALELLERMRYEGCPPDYRTYVAAMVACGNLAKLQGNQQDILELGRRLHVEAAKYGYNLQLKVANATLGMYSKFGSLEDARRLFEQMVHRDLVSWNVIILGCVENGEAEMAWELFERMQRENCAPNGATFVAAAMACGRLAVKESGQRMDGKLVKVQCLEKAMDIYSQAKKGSFDEHMFVASAIMEMFAKCGSMTNAREVFEKMASHDIVAWNEFIAGCVENGEAGLALDSFERMCVEGRCSPNSGTFIAVLMACGSLSAFEAGRRIHADICRNGLERDKFVATGLVDFYGKCSSTSKARRVFESMKTRDWVCWSALLAGCSSCGDIEQVLRLFDEMVIEENGADSVALLCVLTACSRAGLVDKGKKVFKRLVTGEFGIQPGIEHYHCFIDMLGRANLVSEAMETAKTMPFYANAVTWTTVLGACQKWKNVEAGRTAFELFLQTDPRHPAAYSLMANIYGSVGMWQEQRNILERMRNDNSGGRKICP